MKAAHDVIYINMEHLKTQYIMKTSPTRRGSIQDNYKNHKHESLIGECNPHEVYPSKHETLAKGWFTVYDVGPTVNQRWANVSCLLRRRDSAVR